MSTIVDRLPDVALILASASTAMTVTIVAMLLVAQRARVARKLPLNGWFWCAVVLWIVWVMVR